MRPVGSELLKGEELRLSNEEFGEILRSVASERASLRFRAKGFSMSPFIKDGDVLTLSPLYGRPKAGCIVAFIDSITGRPVIHRVLGTRGDSLFLVKGDNSRKIDGLVPMQNILGYVEKIERGGKRVRLGLGRERTLIAFFSRTDLLMICSIPIRKLIRSVARRWRK